MVNDRLTTPKPGPTQGYLPVATLGVIVVVGFVIVEINLNRQQSKSVGSRTPDRATVTQASLIPTQQLRREGHADTALEWVDDILSANPRHFEAYLLRAELLFELHRADEMIPSLNAALTLEPTRFDARANLAFALRYVGRLDEAEREADWCLSRDPKNVSVRRIVAEIQRDRGNIESALRTVREVLQDVPDDIDSRLVEAELLLFQRQPEVAYRRLKPLSLRHQRNPRYLATFARAANAVGRTDEAERCRTAAEQLMIP